MKCDKKTMNRLKRIQGQMSGVVKMIEEQRNCEEIVIQLSAVRSSIDKLMMTITTSNLIQTIEERHQIKLAEIDDAVDLVIRSK